MKKHLLILLLVLSYTLTQGQNTPTVIGQQGGFNKVITTAVPFLAITPDSRAAGLGDAGVASSPDVNSAYWNAAKLAFIDKGYGASLSYTPWLAKIINDMKLVYLTGFYKISRQQTVALSLKYFDLGRIDFRTLTNQPNGSFNPRDYSFDVTYAQMLTEQLSIGGTLRYIYSNLTGAGVPDAKPGSSVAVDLGVYYRKPLLSSNATLSLGASISNIGAKISYTDANSKDFLPGNLRIGGAFRKELDPFNSLTFLLDFNKLLVPSPPNGKSKPLLSGTFGSFSDAPGGFVEEIHEISTSLGIEYWYKQTFSGRLGYFYEAPDKGNRNYITGGFGVRFNQFGLDAAYLVPINQQNNALAETLRFSLMILIPTKESQEEESVKD